MVERHHVEHLEVSFPVLKTITPVISNQYAAEQLEPFWQADTGTYIVQSGCIHPSMFLSIYLPVCHSSVLRLAFGSSLAKNLSVVSFK